MNGFMMCFFTATNIYKEGKDLQAQQHSTEQPKAKEQKVSRLVHHESHF
jgi:hypothetical protein